jgi:RNA polymerase sigma factor (sigma-70 family)
MTGTADLDPDLELARRMRDGDRAAVGELYDHYAGIALAVAVRILGDRDAAEDAVHDGFVNVWQKIDRYDAARGPLRAWLLAIVRNGAIDRVRRTRPYEDVNAADARSVLRTTPNPTWEAVVEALDQAALRQALEALPAEQREAVELAYFGGYTYRQVAAIVGVPVGTAAGRLRLALARLRASLMPPASPSAGGR